MSFDKLNTRNSTTVIKAVCAIVFSSFSFIYLYFHQADLLAMTQHSLSGGATSYDKLIGAVLITFVLQLLQVGVYAVTRLQRHTHALTYFPSLFFLSVISGFSDRIYSGEGFSSLIWIIPIVLLLWLVVVTVSRGMLVRQSPETGMFSRTMWINILIMAAMFLMVGIAGNGNAVAHYRMSVETSLLEQDNERALKAGCRSLETDSSLTMLRVYALARAGELGERLFSYPIKGTSKDIVPTLKGTSCLLYPNYSIYRFLGAIPRYNMDAITYLEVLRNNGQGTEAVKDYILCGYLIDKDLDGFVSALLSYYGTPDSLSQNVCDSLPKHYREALTLYVHTRSNPAFVYHNSVMDMDFEDLQALEKQYPSFTERKIKVYDQYSGTYWWYYEYE